MRSETEIQNLTRVAIQDAGGVAWRNNRGSLPNPDTGIPIRFGLANDSSKLDKVFKTGDLVGLFPLWLPVGVSTGYQIGVFCMWECKPEDWHWTATGRELAQWAAIQFVRARFGRAGFVTHPDQAVAIAQGTGLGAWNAAA